MRYDRGSQNQDLHGRLRTIAVMGRFSSVALGLGAWRSMHHLAMGRYAHFSVTNA